MRAHDLGSPTVKGARPAEPQELLRAADRISFVYVERAVVHRDSNAVTVTDARGVIHIPAATIGCLLLGPGTSVTHAAISLLAASGATAVWTGEKGVRYYAHGRPLARSSRLLDAQARLCSNRLERLAVARQMYAMRFPGEDTAGLTMQQLRGREGARVRRTYREHSHRTGVKWSGRDYRPDDFDASDDINRALSSAHTSLYGAVHAVVVALGCSPGLGFVHTGHDRSFVYDVADLYKAELSIPVAFDVVAASVADVDGSARRLMRERLVQAQLLSRCASDVRRLLLPDHEAADGDGDTAVIVSLWDEFGPPVDGGRNHAAGEDQGVDW